MTDQTFLLYQKYLSEFLRYKSVSTDPKFREDMKKAVQFLISLFQRSGFETKLLNHPRLNPVVFSSYRVNPKLPTLLIYGHYDVQPANEADWDFNPFQLTQREGRFLGRGVVDDKGQVLIHIVNVILAIKNKTLKYNLKFLIEGDEETDNVEELAELIKDNTDLLQSDYVLISDGELVGGKPTIEASFRGGFNAQLTYEVAKTNVHSGIYGGAVPNAVHEMARLINNLYDNQGRVKISHFYNDVDPITQKELSNNKKLVGLSKNPAQEGGFKSLIPSLPADFYTTTGLQPTIQVTGIKGGYTDHGFANIVVARATAKFNFRTVSSQESRLVFNLFKKFVQENTPAYVTYQLEAVGFHEPVKLDLKKPIFAKTKQLLEKVYQPPIPYHYVGAAIPFIAVIKKLFGIDSISVGLANQDCNMHGVHENFKISLIKKGLEFSRRFLSEE